jgi:cytochrome c
MKLKFLLLSIAASLLLISCSNELSNKVLVFSKTDGFRHESIPDGIKMIERLGEENGFEVFATEDASFFSEVNLKEFKVVVFLSTTQDVLDPSQELEFQRFIQAGGGFVGIHAAADTEYDWPWYGGLVGAYFESHPNNPNVREAIVNKTEHKHQSTNHLPDNWERNDEWYNYKDISENIIPILNLDEGSYEGGTNGENHPIAWYHEYDGGRAFYTGGGHTSESFEEEEFVAHVLEGIQWAMGDKKPVQYGLSSVAPAENRFQKMVLDDYFNEPMELELMPDGRILFIERKGAIKLFDPEEGVTKTIHTHEVYKGQEDGLLGVALDPNFASTGWIFLCYSHPEEWQQNISRFDFDPDAEEVLSNEKVVLTIETQRDECCHSAGSLEFDSEGNLWASFGDDTNPHQSDGYAPIDEREGRGPFDAQKSSSNPNDLRGSIIRITPQEDGSYTIPEGNLFPSDGSAGRPEVFVKGCRNPFRFSIDPRTKYVYWGDVGPDADNDGATRGPRGYDEVNQAKAPGFFGWPYFIADNKPYFDFNFSTETQGAQFDPEQPVNDSPNNTGLQNLPPAQPAMIYYPYAESEEFPMVGSGGRNAMAGPVFYRDDYPENPDRYPEYYNGKLFTYDWMRGWMMSVSFDQDGNYQSMERFLPSIDWNNLMDVVMSPNGDMYMIEYGTGWFTANKDARLVHLKYTGGNRSPVAEIAADKTAGSLPFTVNFDASGSFDADGDDLHIVWDFGDGETSSGISVSHTYPEPGTYVASVTVTDMDGLTAANQVKIYAGNTPPEVTINLNGNRQFYWPGDQIEYVVEVTDAEDSPVNEENVTVTADFLRRGFDLTEIAQGHQSAMSIEDMYPGKAAISQSDCVACHKPDGISVGPSYVRIAEKYARQRGTIDYLSEKIISGGGGVWGETAMAAHPALSERDAKNMAEYILSFGKKSGENALPMKGSYTVNVPSRGRRPRSLIFLASYEDQGGEGVPSLVTQDQVVLKPATLVATEATSLENATEMIITSNMVPTLEEDLPLVIASHDAVIQFENIDLTGVGSISFIASASAMFAAGGTLDVYLDNTDADPIGTGHIPLSQGMGQPSFIPVSMNGVDGTHTIIVKVTSDDPTKSAGSLLSLVFNKV